MFLHNFLFTLGKFNCFSLQVSGGVGVNRCRRRRRRVRVGVRVHVDPRVLVADHRLGEPPQLAGPVADDVDAENVVAVGGVPLAKEHFEAVWKRFLASLVRREPLEAGQELRMDDAAHEEVGQEVRHPVVLHELAEGVLLADPVRVKHQLDFDEGDDGHLDEDGGIATTGLEGADLEDVGD